MALEEYGRKRHFNRTPEPPAKKAREGGKRYCIQKHAASRLHYDFRLEHGGVMWSWAVPKGPSLDTKERRLAVQVEDHPVDYASFEGIIPEGEYGGGTVLLWDEGTWTPKGDAANDYRRGELKFTLDGKKLKGGWMLIRLKPRPGERSASWLLIKERDEHVRPLDEYDVLEEEAKSVTTKRSLDQIAEQRDKVWGSNRAAKSDGTGSKMERLRALAGSSPPGTKKKTQTATVPKRATTKKKAVKKNAAKKTTVKKQRLKKSSSPTRAKKSATNRATKKSARAKRSTAKRAGRTKANDVEGARRALLPAEVEPELATLTKQAPTGEAWIHEIKFDGYRMLCRIIGKQARFITRHQLDWTARFSELAQAAAKLNVDEAILDGEAVALLPTGVSSFQELQNAFSGGTTNRLVYYVFDLLYLDGYDLRGAKLLDRKRLLRNLIGMRQSASIRYTDHLTSDGPEFLQQSCQLGLEGIISKRIDSRYMSGRGLDWLKTKCQRREELVIGGFTDPNNDRAGFGALLLGYYDNKGQLHYAGRVGTGFSAKLLVELHKRLKAIEQRTSSYADYPGRNSTRGLHWVAPKLVGQIEFSNWTNDGLLRHPSFQGLREDKPAREVRRDVAKPLEQLVEETSVPRKTAKLTASNRAPAKAAAKTAAQTMRKKAASASRNSKAANSKAAAPSKTVEEIEKLTGIQISNPSRVLYEEQGITKLDLANYYLAVADWILPHLHKRPLSLVRCPEGQRKACFYQKHAGPGTPSALERVEVKEKNGMEEYLMINNLAGLIAIAQMGVLEIHPWGSRADSIEKPDILIFDLDPDVGLPWQRVVEAAREMRQRLGELGLESFLKTTGGKGLHVVVPIQRRLEWPAAKQFSKLLVESVARDAPTKYVTNMSKAARKGKIFLDYLRNDRGATAVAPYSTRARAGAPVSMPLEWEELDSDVRGDTYTVENTPARLAALKHDPWQALRETRQGITMTTLKKLGVKG